MYLHLFFYVTLVRGAQNVTEPTVVHGWVSTSCGRGTIDILWTCLATIFICTWTVILLDVPLDAQSTWSNTKAKALCMISIMLFPDSVTTASVLNYTGGRRETALMRRLGVDHYTMTHGYFLDMGGYVLRSPEGELTVLTSADLQRIANAGDMNTYRKEGQLSFHDAGKSELDVDLAQICLQTEWLHDLRKTSEAAIERLAKSDALAKAIACLQVLWLLTQVLSRAIQGLSITLLELSTVSFIAFGISAYAL